VLDIMEVTAQTVDTVDEYETLRELLEEYHIAG
jgi:hypothetical protein